VRRKGGDRSFSLFLREIFLSRTTLMPMEDLKKQFDGERGGATHSLRTEGGGGRVSFLLLCPTAHPAVRHTHPFCADLFVDIGFLPKPKITSKIIQKMRNS